jgi:hypothetical protein
MKGERGGGWREREVGDEGRERRGMEGGRERERGRPRGKRESERDRYTSISQYYLHLLQLKIFPLTLL